MSPLQNRQDDNHQCNQLQSSPKERIRKTVHDIHPILERQEKRIGEAMPNGEKINA